MKLLNHTITFPKNIESFWESDESQIEDIAAWIDNNYDNSNDEVEVYTEVYLPLIKEYNDYKSVTRESQKLSLLNKFGEETNTEFNSAEFEKVLSDLDTNTKKLDYSNFKFEQETTIVDEEAAELEKALDDFLK